MSVILSICYPKKYQIGKFTAMITLHFHLQPQYKYELFHINFTSFHCTGRYELNKLTSLPTGGFIAQLVEHCTGIAEVTGSNPVEALFFFFFQASSFQLLKLENLLRWALFTLIYNRSTLIISYKLHKVACIVDKNRTPFKQGKAAKVYNLPRFRFEEQEIYPEFGSLRNSERPDTVSVVRIVARVIGRCKVPGCTSQRTSTLRWCWWKNPRPEWYLQHCFFSNWI